MYEPVDDEHTQNDLVETLADYAHRAWSGWMKYLFSKSKKNSDGTVTIPKWAVKRWERQMNTLYSDLTEKEKDSDRAEANEIIGIIQEFLRGKL
ncbi:MAG: hypothetical protein GXO75_08395 [Calditrichaeota bacterium]|nr:hypothetical protein [Calditrichota bacterium]